MSDPVNRQQSDEVNLDIEDDDDDDDDDEQDNQNEDITQRLRIYTLNRIAGVLSPLVNNSHLSPLTWLNSGNDENNSGSSNNVNVTISNSYENSLAVSVDILQDTINESINENATTNNNQNEAIETPFQRGENENNNNQTNRTTVDLNINEYIPEIIKCLIFVIILLIKFLFDHLEGVLTFICLHMLMYMFIGVEKSNFRRKSTWRMVVDGLCILKCLGYIFCYNGLPSTLTIYNQQYKSPTDIWNLFWIVYMNDCAIKFITMGYKLLIKFLPYRLMSFRTKLRVYWFFKAISQLYRSVVPIQPWISYFLVSYKDSAYLLSIFLTVVYVILKIYDTLKRLILVKEAIQKLCQRAVHLSPTMVHLSSIGTKCSVCLEDFENPVLLSCHHVFCSTCITQWAIKNKTCPLCRTTMVEDLAPRNISTALYLQLF
ncbi:E3 ubiquitin-protein ligase RNFT1-like [Arctopsyche grandis]|uniref:E3 ubiquitin-protein ligase RNFT1-like n=1 Tax=Arctopsyche grandis TaxID=121162 RepID=UPI00406D875E